MGYYEEGILPCARHGWLGNSEDGCACCDAEHVCEMAECLDCGCSLHRPDEGHICEECDAVTCEECLDAMRIDAVYECPDHREDGCGGYTTQRLWEETKS